MDTFDKRWKRAVEGKPDLIQVLRLRRLRLFGLTWNVATVIRLSPRESVVWWLKPLGCYLVACLGPLSFLKSLFPSPQSSTNPQKLSPKFTTLVVASWRALKCLWTERLNRFTSGTRLSNKFSVRSPCITCWPSSVGSRYPLNGVAEQDIIWFYDAYELPIEKDVFIRGVLALRHQTFIEPRFRQLARSSPEAPVGTKLSIGTHKYTRLEIEVLYNAWTRGKRETLKNLSRLHRLLIVACIYAAMTQ